MLNTIIIPVFQDYSIFSLFVDSLIKTVVRSTQIIFINDGSGGEVQNFLEKFESMSTEDISYRIITHRYPKGCASSINEALNISNGRYIFFLDSDTILQENWQEKMKETFYEDNGIGIVGGALLYPQTGGVQHCGIAFTDSLGRHLFLNAMPDFIPQKIFSVQAVVFAMCAIKREVFDKVGYLDENFFNGYEDLDYQMRALESGFKVVVNPQVVAYHWERSNGIHRNFNRKSNLALFWKKWGRTIKPDLWLFVFERIKHQIFTNEQNENPSFIGIDLAEARSDSSFFWNELKKQPYIEIIDIIDYSSYCTSEGAIWLPQYLNKDLFRYSQRFLFLVDNFVRLLENQYWLKLRKTFRDDDLVVDLYGNVILFSRLFESSWPGTKTR